MVLHAGAPAHITEYDNSNAIHGATMCYTHKFKGFVMRSNDNIDEGP